MNLLRYNLCTSGLNQAANDLSFHGLGILGDFDVSEDLILTMGFGNGGITGSEEKERAISGYRLRNEPSRLAVTRRLGNIDNPFCEDTVSSIRGTDDDVDFAPIQRGSEADLFGHRGRHRSVRNAVHSQVNLAFQT